MEGKYARLSVLQIEPWDNTPYEKSKNLFDALSLEQNVFLCKKDHFEEYFNFSIEDLDPKFYFTFKHSSKIRDNELFEDLLKKYIGYYPEKYYYQNGSGLDGLNDNDNLDEELNVDVFHSLVVYFVDEKNKNKIELYVIPYEEYMETFLTKEYTSGSKDYAVLNRLW